MPSVILLAKVIEVKNGPYWFPRCKLCFRKVHCREGTNSNSFRWNCVCGWSCDDGDVSYAYRLPLTVTDGIALAHVTVFGNQLHSIFGVPADKLLSCLSQAASVHDIGSILHKLIVGQYFDFTFNTTSNGSNSLTNLTAAATLHGNKKSLIAKCMHLETDGSNQYKTVMDYITANVSSSSIQNDDLTISVLSLRAMSGCLSQSNSVSVCKLETSVDCDNNTAADSRDSSPIFDSVFARTSKSNTRSESSLSQGSRAQHLKSHHDLDPGSRNRESDNDEGALARALAECSLDSPTFAEDREKSDSRHFLTTFGSVLDECNWTELENCDADVAVDNVTQSRIGNYKSGGTRFDSFDFSPQLVSDDCITNVRKSSILPFLPSQASPAVICSTPVQRHPAGRRRNVLRLCTRQALLCVDNISVSDDLANTSAVPLCLLKENKADVRCVGTGCDENCAPPSTAANCSADLFD